MQNSPLGAVGIRRARRVGVGLMLVSSVMALGCQGGALTQTDLTGDDVSVDMHQRRPVADGDASGDAPDMSNFGGVDAAPDGVDMSVDEPETEPWRHPNELAQERFFTCQAGAQLSSPARLRRVNRLQWTRNVGRALSNTPAHQNPLRHKNGLPYSTFAADHSLEAELLDAYIDVVSEAGHVVIGRTDEPNYRYVTPAWMYRERRALGIECMYDDSAAPDPACVDAFVKLLLERTVYQRQASPEELSQLADFAKTEISLEASEQNTRSETIARIVSAAWLTTGALFSSELGVGESDDIGRRALGPWEIAHAVGAALMSRRPGAVTSRESSNGVYNGPDEGHMIDIYRAAEDGSITDRQVLAELLRAHLTGAGYDDSGAPTHVGGLDGERLDVRLEERGAYVHRGEYGLPEGVREFFVEYFDYEDANAKLKTDSAKTSKYWQIPDIHHPMYGSIFKGRESLLTGRHGQATHKEQLDDMIARVVVRDEDVLQGLLTSRTFFLPSNDGAGRRLATAQSHLASDTDNRRSCDGHPDASACAQAEFEWLSRETEYINAPYNHDDLIELDQRDQHWVDLPATERAGVLTHPAWLSSHGANFENDASAIYRGKWVVEHLFCGHIPDVPINVDAQLDPESSENSARYRISEKTDTDPFCSSCHNVMNPVGYSFEIYNHAGFIRVDNHEQAGDFGVATIPDFSMVPAELRGKTIRDAVELNELLGGSAHARQCFVRHTFRYFMGRYEREADACTLAQMDQVYVDNGGSFKEMLIALLTSDTFLFRHIE